MNENTSLIHEVKKQKTYRRYLIKYLIILIILTIIGLSVTAVCYHHFYEKYKYIQIDGEISNLTTYKYVNYWHNSFKLYYINISYNYQVNTSYYNRTTQLEYAVKKYFDNFIHKHKINGSIKIAYEKIQPNISYIRNLNNIDESPDHKTGHFLFLLALVFLGVSIFIECLYLTIWINGYRHSQKKIKQIIISNLDWKKIFHKTEYNYLVSQEHIRYSIENYI